MAQRLIDAARFDRRLMFTVDRDEICDDCLRNFLNEMAKEPTIDPVKHEHWELCEDGLYKCTGEGCTQKANKYQRLLWDYCPKCGAKMWRGTDGKG